MKLAMKHGLLMLLMGLFLFALPACTTVGGLLDRVESHPRTSKAIVQEVSILWMSRIDNPVETARNVREYTAGLYADFDQQTFTTLDQLLDHAEAQVNWSRYSPAEQLRLRNVLGLVREVITEMIEGDAVDANAIVQISTVANWVDEAAALVIESGGT